EQGGLESLALAVGFGAAELLNGTSAFDRDAKQSANGFQGLPGKWRAINSETADGLHSQANRTVAKSSCSIDIGLFALVGESELLFLQLQRAVTRAVVFLFIGKEQTGGTGLKGINDMIGNGVHQLDDVAFAKKFLAEGV